MNPNPWILLLLTLGVGAFGIVLMLALAWQIDPTETKKIIREMWTDLTRIL